MRKQKENIEATYRVASRTFGFAKLDNGEELYVAAKDSLDAMNDDRVLIKVISEKYGEKKKREAKVVKIIERFSDLVVGYFEPSGHFGFVTPINKKIPFDIHVGKKFFGKAVKDSIVEVKILPKKQKNDNPEGIIVKILGHKNDPNAELTAIIRDFKVRDTFDEDTLREADEVAKPMEKGDLEGRKDLREKTFVTIDGEDTKDIDDAVYLEDAEDGYKKLYVSISDVSYYVKEKSFLDMEAMKRGNSVYLLDRVIPMLPHVLSNGMCSLNEGEDRLTMTCEMTFDDKGNIVTHDIYESVICSHRRMTYTEVQGIIDGSVNSDIDHSIVKMILDMIKLSRIVRKKRYDRGAISFDLKETYIDVDKNLRPVGVKEKVRIEAYELIEDFMVSANETVAEEYFFTEVPFIYRVHEPSDEDKLKTLLTTLRSIGVPCNINVRKSLKPKDIQKLLKSVEGEDYQSVVEKLILRSMSQARYSKKELGHFALAAKYYTHFTSPIRRYSDLQIHRIMHEIIDGKFDDRRYKHYDDILDGIAQHISKTERTAIDLERDIEALKKCEYMKDFIGDTFEGNISGMTSYGMFVELDNTVEGMIAFRDMKNDRYNFDEMKYKVVGERTHKTFLMGQRVKVMLVKATPEIRAVDFFLLEDD